MLKNLKKTKIALAGGLLLSLGLTGVLLAGDKSEFKSQFKESDRVFYNINVDEVTSAPQRAYVRAHLKSSPEAVFAKIADHRNLRDWIPMIDHLVEVDNSKSQTPGSSDAGTERVCIFGGDRLVETIRHWAPGKGYSYSIAPGKDLVAEDHLGVMTLEDDGQGGTFITWRQYFNPKAGSFKGKYIMPTMMKYVMKKALKNLTKEFGGEVI